MIATRAAIGVALAMAGCGFNPDEAPTDAAVIDAAEIDAAADDASVDAATDAAEIDASSIDARVIDAAVIDAAMIDAPAIDAPDIDAPAIDAPVIDAPDIDALPIDAMPVDAPIDAPWVLNGTYAVTPAPSYSCATGLVSFNITSFTFSTMTAMLRAQGAPCLMSGVEPTGTDFSLTCSIAGLCTETYSLMGTITGPTTFTATFRAAYTGTCMDCSTQTWNVSGSM